MKFQILLLFSITILWHSCDGQTHTKFVDSRQAVANGDTVATLSNRIWYVFQSSNGDYWFGSDTDGAFRLVNRRLINYTTKDGMSSNRIRGIQEDKKGNIFFSTLNGIDKFDGRTFANLTAIKSKSPGDHWKLQADDLWFTMIGRNGEKGPYRYDGKKLYQLQFPKHYMEENYFKQFPVKPWSPYEVYYIYKDRKGHMWFGTSNFGLCRYDGQSHSWLYEDQLIHPPNGGSFGVRSILEDNKGKFWICNTRYRYHIADDITTEPGKVLINYQREPGIEIKTPAGTDHVYILSMLEDENNNLWMATYSEGVWKFDGQTVTHYEVKDGSKDITIFTIYKDRSGTLWLGTHQNGVYKFNGRTFEKFIY